MHFGEIAIAQIEFDSKSRDDIPAVLKGLQHIYTNPPLRERVFALLLEQVRPGVDLKVGRPGYRLVADIRSCGSEAGVGLRFRPIAGACESAPDGTADAGAQGKNGFRKDQTSYYQLQNADRQCVASGSATVVTDWPGNSAKRSRGGEKKAGRAIARAL